jgi:hypothetical protein
MESGEQLLLRVRDALLTRGVLRVSVIGLLLSIAAIATEIAITAVPPDTPAIMLLHFGAGLLGAFAIPMAVLFTILLVASLFGVLVRDWKARRIIGVTLVTLGVVVFLLLPFCASPKSADCRSIVARSLDLFRK